MNCKNDKREKSYIRVNISDNVINNKYTQLLNGFRQTIPFAPSFVFFGLILGFTAHNGNISWGVMASTGVIIFAGSAQFLTIVFLINNQPLFLIAITAIVINLRHLLYGAVMNKLFSKRKISHLGLAYFLTDETFLITSLFAKEQVDMKQDLFEWFYLGSGLTLWTLWNTSLTIGYFLGSSITIFSGISENIIIAATFVGYLISHWQKFPEDRPTLIFSTIMVFILVLFHFATSSMLLLIMLLGAGFATFELYYKNRRDNNE